MTKRKQQNLLLKLLGREDWKFPVGWNLRVLKEAVYFARENELVIPPPYCDRLIVKVFSLLWERGREPEEDLSGLHARGAAGLGALPGLSRQRAL